MPPSIGTRSKQSFRQGHVEHLGETQGHQQDLGLTKRVSASVTFTAADNKASAANGTFAAFAAGDDLLIEGANLNNGLAHVNGIDATNQAYLVLDQAPKDEGPLTVTLRTA